MLKITEEMRKEIISNFAEEAGITYEDAKKIVSLARYLSDDTDDLTLEEIKVGQNVSILIAEQNQYIEIANNAMTGKTEEEIEEMLLSKLHEYLTIANSVICKIYGLPLQSVVPKDSVFEESQWVTMFNPNDQNLKLTFDSDGEVFIARNFVHDDNAQKIALHSLFMPVRKFAAMIRNEAKSAKAEQRRIDKINIVKEMNKAKQRLAYLGKIKKEVENNE